MNRFISLRRITLAMFASAMVGLAFPALADESVPFKGRADVAITSVEPEEDGLHITTSGSGVATHLGLYTREEAVVLYEDGTLDGSIIFKAADGDLLYVSFSGGFTSPTTATGTYTITGGTGRFTEASGEATFSVVTSDGVHFAVTFAGTIEY